MFDILPLSFNLNETLLFFPQTNSKSATSVINSTNYYSHLLILNPYLSSDILSIWAPKKLNLFSLPSVFLAWFLFRFLVQALYCKVMIFQSVGEVWIVCNMYLSVRTGSHVAMLLMCVLDVSCDGFITKSFSLPYFTLLINFC